MCLSEQYAKCALAACLDLVFVGYTDPSRLFEMNEETTLCSSRKVMDAASAGSAAPSFRYFCSPSHCEEGKEDHELTMKEYNSELARKESDLKRMQEELNADMDNFMKRVVDCQQKHAEFDEALKRDRENHELTLRELKAARPLKEMG